MRYAKESKNATFEITNLIMQEDKIYSNPADSDRIAYYSSDVGLGGPEEARLPIRSTIGRHIDSIYNIFHLAPVQYGLSDVNLRRSHNIIHIQEEAGPPTRILEHPSWRMPGENLFFTLPRELRDQIYRWVLLPSLAPYLIEPYQLERKTLTKRKQKPKQRSNNTIPAPFKICLDPVNFSPSEYHTTQRVALSRHFNYTTLSLLRTNQQIYNETHELFWHNVVFYFPQFNYKYLQPKNRAVRVLKEMGQIPSRLIRHIRIRFDGQRDAKGELPKLLRLLASRARLGEFRLLELMWSADEFYELVAAHLPDAAPSSVDRYDALLEYLRVDATDCGYDRIIRFDEECISTSLYPICWGPTEMAEDDTKETIKALHFACGGSVYFEDKLLWQNYQQVNDISKLCHPPEPEPDPLSLGVETWD
jgi:hypothetical protein